MMKARKALALLLALVFAVSLATVLPAARASDNVEITDIALTFPMPSAGDPIDTYFDNSPRTTTPEFSYDHVWLKDTGAAWAYGTFEKGKVYNISFRIFPNEGYQISSIGSVHITVNGDSNIYEAFHNKTYKCETVRYVIAIPDPDNPFYSVAVDGGAADKPLAVKDDTVTVTAEKRKNFTFIGWDVVSGGVTLADQDAESTTFVMGDQDVSLKARYKYSGPLLTEFNVYITPPVAGEPPQPPTVKSDDYEVSAYSWVRITSEDSGKMKEGDVFEEGSGILYQCRVDLNIPAYAADDADKLHGYVNDSAKTDDGFDVKISRSSFSKVKVVGSFNCAPAPADYTVTFDACGGVVNSSSDPTVDMQTNSDGTLGMLPFPTRQDFTFEGWFTEKEGGDEVTASTVFSSDTRVYAHWKGSPETPPEVPPEVPDAPAEPEGPGEEAQPNPFTDVTESDPYYDAVLWAYYAKPQVTNGMTDTTFGPELTVTRGQCVAFLWRAAGEPKIHGGKNPFTDVPADQYYYKAVLWAVGEGITDGVTDTTFEPDTTLSTQHIITFLYRALNPGEDGWNGEAAAWAGKDHGGKPFGVDIAVNNKTDCPRANVVQFLHEALK